MARKRNQAGNVNINAEQQRIRRRNPRQYGYTEQKVARKIEPKRFAAFEAEDDFIPLTYDPTHTSWPANGYNHRRTSAAGYDKRRGILRIEFFTDGALYDYGTVKPVPPSVAMAFRRANSPGRFKNTTLEAYGYERIN